MCSRKLEMAVVIIAHKHLSIWSFPLSSDFYHLVSICMVSTLLSKVYPEKVDDFLMYAHHYAR